MNSEHSEHTRISINSIFVDCALCKMKIILYLLLLCAGIIWILFVGVSNNYCCTNLSTRSVCFYEFIENRVVRNRFDSQSKINNVHSNFYPFLHRTQVLIGIFIQTKALRSSFCIRMYPNIFETKISVKSKSSWASHLFWLFAYIARSLALGILF